MSNITPFVVPPDLRATLDAFKAEVFYDLNCHQLGEITAFNPATQTASVQIMSNIETQTQTYRYPLLTDCPVFVLSGGGGCITMPIAVGDSCLVLFNDRYMDDWFATGIECTPSSNRTHSLSDGLVLVGFRNLSNSIAGYDSNELQIRNGPGRITISPSNGKLSMSNDLGSMHNALNKVVQALTALNTVKSGGTAAVQIGAAQAAIDDILA